MKKHAYYILIMILLLLSVHTAYADEGGYIIQADVNDERLVCVPEENVISERLGFYYAADEKEFEAFCENYKVLTYERNAEVELFDVPDDTGYSERWDAPLFNLPHMWDYDIDLSGVKVAVIDTGIMSGHEDLDYDRIIPVHNFCAERKIIAAGGDLNAEENREAVKNVEDDEGHGTSVAGVIGAVRNNGTGSFGMAYGADIYVFKAFSKYCDSMVCILEAMDKCLEYDIDVVNLSLGANEGKEIWQEAVDMLTKEGIIVVSAAGNGGEATMYYPAGCEGVIGVGSVNKLLTRSTFSQYNSSVDVTAPGDMLYTTNYAGGYSSRNGTSFSSPYVAAMAAVAKAVDKSISHDEFFELIKETSIDKGTEGYDVKYGWGVLHPSRFTDALADRYGLLYKDSSAVIADKTEYEGKMQLELLRCAREYSVYVVQYSEDGAIERVQTVGVDAGEGRKTVEFEMPDENVRLFLWDSVMHPLVKEK